MKRRTVCTLSMALYLSACLAWSQAAEIELYFSPNGGAAAAVATEIGTAKKTIRVMAYSISEDGITRALIAAQARGIDVRLIVDPNQRDGTYSTANKISIGGVPTLVDGVHTLMHDKTMVIDDSVTITGSMNFTENGNKHNAENLLVIRDAVIAARFAADWTKHAQHSNTFTATHSRRFKKLPTPPSPPLVSSPAHTQEP